MVSEILLILLFFFDCALSVIIYLHNPKGVVNKILFFLLIPVTLTNLDILLITAAETGIPSRAGYNMATVAGIFFYPIVYTLSCFFPRTTVTRKDLWRFIVIYAVPVVLGTLFLVFYADDPGFRQFPILSLLHRDIPGGYSRVLFTATNLSYILYEVTMLVAVIRRLLLSLNMRILKRERTTVFMILWGFIPLSILLLFTYLIFPPLERGIYIHLIASGFWTFYVVLLTLRFEFVDRKALLRVFIVYPVVLVVVMGSFRLFLGRFNRLVTEYFSVNESFIIGMEVVLFGTLLNPLVRSLTHTMGRIVSSEEAVFHRVIKELSVRMATVIELEELDRLFTEMFLERLKVRRFFFLVEDERAGVFRTVNRESDSPVFPIDGELVSRLVQERKICSFQQLSLSWHRLLELKVLDDNRIRLIVPLFEGHRLPGILLIGDPGIATVWHSFEIEEIALLSGGIPVVIERCMSHGRAIEVEKKLARIEKTAVLSELTSSVAHEVRNPISIIATSAETLADRELPPEETRKIAGYIQEETSRISHLLNRILAFAGSSDLEPQAVDAAGLVRRVFDMLLSRAKENDVTMEVSTDNAPALAMMDKEGLLQVCLNLTLNALEAVPRGGRVSCALSHADDGRLRLVFSDSGPPIPEEVRARIFEPFYTTKKEGTGLGLAVSQRIIRESGGSIGLLSGEGETAFEIILPVPDGRRHPHGGVHG